MIASLVGSLKTKIEFTQFVAIANQGFISLIGIGRTAVLVRVLGPHDYGILGLALAVGGTVAMAQGLGLGVGAAKEAARAATAEARGFVALVLVAVRGVLVLPFALLLWLSSRAIGEFYEYAALQQCLSLYAIFMLANAPSDVLGYVLTGSQRFRDYFRLRLVNEIVVTVLVVAMILQWGLVGYFVGQTVGAAFCSIILGAAIWGSGQSRIRWPGRDHAVDILRSSLGTGLSIFVGKLSRSVSVQVPILVAGRFMLADQVGWLKFGMQAGGYAGTLLSAAQVIILPKMVGHLRQRGPAAMFDSFSRNLVRLSTGVALVVICVVAIAPELVRLVGGGQYHSSIRPFQATVVFYAVIFLADSIYSGIYLPLDRERAYVASYLVYGVVGTGLAVAAIALGKAIEWPVYGLVLAAWIHLTMALARSGAGSSNTYRFVASCARVMFAVGVAVGLMAQEGALYRIVIGALAAAVLLLEALVWDPTKYWA